MKVAAHEFIKRREYKQVIIVPLTCELAEMNIASDGIKKGMKGYVFT